MKSRPLALDITRSASPAPEPTYREWRVLTVPPDLADYINWDAIMTAGARAGCERTIVDRQADGLVTVRQMWLDTETER